MFPFCWLSGNSADEGQGRTSEKVELEAISLGGRVGWKVLAGRGAVEAVISFAYMVFGPVFLFYSLLLDLVQVRMFMGFLE